MLSAPASVLDAPPANITVVEAPAANIVEDECEPVFRHKKFFVSPGLTRQSPISCAAVGRVEEAPPLLGAHVATELSQTSAAASVTVVEAAFTVKNDVSP